MEYTIRPYIPGEEVYVADAHHRVYSTEYHWGNSFIDYAEDIALSFPKKEKTDREELWIAEADGKPLGCIMLCQTEDKEIGQLRLFLVEKECRHYGIGTALTKALLSRAHEAGYKELILWSASPLHDAISHYEKLGFIEEERMENRTWSIDGDIIYEVKMRMSI